MSRKLTLIVLLLALSLAAIAAAQDILPNPETETDPNAVISWPPPVYVLRGEVELYGTANLPGLTSTFLEFRPLLLPGEVDGNGEPIDPDEERPWFPITLPSSLPVIDDVLGSWNTLTTADGLYEIRLTVNGQAGESATFVLRPIRVENNPPRFVMLEAEPTFAPPAPDLATATPRPGRPTLMPSPTPVSSSPMVTANLNANVRAGDDTQYAIVGALRTNQSADVIGISSTGSGWFYIRLPDGAEGWIAPSVVSESGDFSRVPRIAPPPPPATPTPIPPTAPPASGDLAASPPSVTPATPTCNVPFSVLVNITNTGTAPTTSPVQVLIRDVHVASGTITNQIVRDVPILQPGQNWVVGSTEFVVSTFFEEGHRIDVVIDYLNQAAETNEGNNNVSSVVYTLARGGC